MNEADQTVLLQRFVGALGALDVDGLREICTDDVSWTIPGESRISGRKEGVEEIISVARTTQEYGIVGTVEKVFQGRDSMVILVSDKGNQNGRNLDIQVALSIEFRDCRISALVAHHSDVAMLTSYLAH